MCRQRRKPDHPLAPIPGERQRRTGHEKWDVAAELGGELKELVSGHHVAGEGVDGMQRGGGIARSSAQAGARGYAFFQVEVHGKTLTRGLEHSTRGPHREVVGCRSNIWSNYLDRYSTSCSPLGPDRVGKADEAQQSLQPVIPVGVSGEHPEEQVDLCERCHGNLRSHGS
jgi:hypothetical protein